MYSKSTALVVVILLFLTPGTTVLAQPPSWTFDLMGKEKKPERFENRKLGSEKTADKKFTAPRRFVQNTITHYNFFFNANAKINTIIERAKISLQPDYGRMLPFYPYSLNATAAQANDLDSVIQKCTAGILLHDLRNSWVDNLYLLIGKAYFLRKDFDSAGMTFQFINYNLFPRKKGEDDSRVVGTNGSGSSTGISIANPEKRNFFQKLISRPPSRNESLIWLVRNLIEVGDYGEAAGLVNTLQNDANLPKRLYPDLEEAAAYLFYKQNMYDSAAVHLEKALSNADSKQDKSRWEFLLGQMLEMSGQYDKASTYYSRASRHTVDPLMDIYARLNEAKMLRKGSDVKALDNSIDNLLRMARKDKFESYRDIIYYSASQIALQKPDTTEAVGYLYKSLRYNESNVSVKNKTFLQLGDIAFDRREYEMAYNWYDSLQTGDTTIFDRLAEVQARRNALSKIVEKIKITAKEDSLQKIAALPPAEMDAYIKKLVRQLRKAQGLKEESNDGGGGAITFDSDRAKPADLFENNNSKGAWYFYNAGAKSKGFNEFKNKWGGRTNADNWRRKASQNALPGLSGGANEANGDGKNGKAGTGANSGQEISFDALKGNLPLTPEKLAVSHATLSTNLYALGLLYQTELEDYEQAIATYDICLERYPDSLYDGDIYLNLFFCYSKLGNTGKANYYKNLLTNGKLANTKAAKLVANPGAVNPNVKIPAATKAYENIYTLFIEGKFDEALRQKKAADSTYGKNYWSPQLLYIEAMYYVKQRNDSVAHLVLSDIVNLYPKSPLKDKAQNLMEVLKRRKEIEDYLTKLEVVRAKEDDPIKVDDKPVAVTRPVQQQGPVVQQPAAQQPTAVTPPKPAEVKPLVVTAPARDSVKKAPALASGPYKMEVDAPHFVLMILDKVDPVYVNEAKNAFVRYSREGYSSEPIEVSKDTLDKERNLLVFTPFVNGAAALAYADKLKRVAPTEVSWLPAGKYSFIIITADNLQRLKTTKDLTTYKKLLMLQYPGKF